MSEISLTVQSMFSDALQHYRARRLHAAERTFRQILAIDACHPDSLHLLGVILCQLGRHDVAIELIDNAIAINGNVASYHSSLGNALQALGRFEDAVARYERALALKPDHAEAHYQRANNKKFSLGDTDMVILERLAADSGNIPVSKAPFIHFSFGKALEDAGEYAQAFEHLLKETL